MLRRCLWTTLLVCAVCVAQTAVDDSLRFEVSSLKASPTKGPGGGIIRPTPGSAGYHAENMPLRTYLMVAMTLRDTQISGAPSWFTSDPYDLEAKAEKQSTPEELHIMLRNLLVDRCKLKYHIENKEQSGYALVVDKDGPKLTEHDEADKNYPPIGGAGPGKIQATNVKMDYFALFLSRIVDRPVVDKTGLTKRYDFKLEVAPQGAANGEAPPIEGPNPFDAIKQQLGLKLEPTKATTQHLVIDHVEKPTDN